MNLCDYDELKKKEREFQDAKYLRSGSGKGKYQSSLAEVEGGFLTPPHLGGHRRGLLYGRTVEKLSKEQIEGKRILDYCCGRGDLGVFLASKGAKVEGFDFSERAIEIAKCKAEANDVHVEFRVMDAEELSYPNEYFDLVIGFEALHHVIIYPGVPSELARVVRKGGKIFFAENWGGKNPLFQFWRSMTTLRRNRSSERGEVILDGEMLERYLGPYFSTIEVDPMSLLYMGKKHIRNQLFLKIFLRIDNALTGMLPSLRTYCGESVIKLTV